MFNSFQFFQALIFVSLSDFKPLRSHGGFIPKQIERKVHNDSIINKLRLAVMIQIDFQTCLDNGVITRDMKPICPVDECGRFKNEITDFCGQYVKDADKNICKYLKVCGIS